MPPSIEALTSSSAPAWSTVLIALKRPLPSPNVIVPKQSLETRRPVLPSVVYSMMPSNCWYIRGCHENNAEKRVGRPSDGPEQTRGGYPRSGTTYVLQQELADRHSRR